VIHRPSKNNNIQSNFISRGQFRSNGPTPSPSNDTVVITIWNVAVFWPILFNWLL